LLDRFRDSAGAFTKVVNQLRRFLCVAHDLAHLFDRSKYTFEIARIGDKHGDVLALKLLREDFELRRGRDQNHLRLQGNYSFKTRIECVTNFSDGFRGGRKIAVSGSSDQSITGADCKNDFRQIRGK
jgi:hypothetical protein